MIMYSYGSHCLIVSHSRRPLNAVNNVLRAGMSVPFRQLPNIIQRMAISVEMLQMDVL